MSKTAKGLSAALIICVLAVVGGLFACKPLVEQAVRDALRNVNPDATICSIDTVDINPLSFTLKLGNIRISDQRTYDTVLKEATMTLSPRFVLACVPFLRDSILPAAGDAPLFSSATGRDLTEKSLIPGEPMTCTVEALTSGPVAMDAAVLKRLLNGQQVPEGEFMISIIAEKVTYGPVRISSTAPETPMQSSVAAVSIEGVDRRTWKRMTMDATEVIIRSEGAFKMGKLEIRDIFLPDADWFGRFLSLVRRADDLSVEAFEPQLEALILEAARPRKDAAGKQVLVVCNFNPVLREGYTLGAPVSGTYKEILNSDDAEFGGSGAVHNKAVRTKKKPLHGFEQSITITLPPMSTLYFEVPAKRSPRKKAEDKATEKAEKTTAKKTTRTTKAKAEKPAEEKPKKTVKKTAKAEAAAEQKAPAKRGRKSKAETAAEAEPAAKPARKPRTKKTAAPKE